MDDPDRRNGVNWGRVFPFAQDAAAIKKAYQRGGGGFSGVGYALGDMANRTRNNFAAVDRDFTAAAKKVGSNAVVAGAPIVAGIGNIYRGIAGADPAVPSAATPPVTPPRATYTTGGDMEGGPTQSPTLSAQTTPTTQPQGISQIDMLEEQTRGFDTAADRVVEQNARFDAMGEQPGPPMPKEVIPGTQPGTYVNATPPEGYGAAIYSDSVGGAQGIRARGNYVQALDENGKPSFAPFGRSADAQKRIQARVAQYEQAIQSMQRMRGVPSERDRLQSRARQRVSLDQGIGGFLNQAADRNYARQELADFDKNQLGIANVMVDAANRKADRELEIQKIGSDRFQFATSKSVDPDTGMPIETPYQFDRMTGISTPIQSANAAPASLTDDQILEDAAKRYGMTVDELKAQFPETFGGK